MHPPPLDGVESAAERPSSELRTSSSVGIVDFVGDFIGGDFIGDAAYVNIDGTTFLPGLDGLCKSEEACGCGGCRDRGGG